IFILMVKVFNVGLFSLFVVCFGSLAISALLVEAALSLLGAALSLRLHSIHSQILSILLLQQAPNISRVVIRQLIPEAPPLMQLLDRYDPWMEEEKHATTETIITMATKHKLQKICALKTKSVHKSCAQRWFKSRNAVKTYRTGG
uniref:Uncharacterized protein n=1 Tax=Xiphophorus maculatus TaxID=8083 RepID=A0A3B5QSU4_XIPMA